MIKALSTLQTLVVLASVAVGLLALGLSVVRLEIEAGSGAAEGGLEP